MLDTTVHGETGRPWVRVAYGRSKGFDARTPFNFVIGNFGDIGRCGLSVQTCFALRRRADLPFCREFIAPPPPPPVCTEWRIGALPPRVRERLERRIRDLNTLANASRAVREGLLDHMAADSERELQARKPAWMMRYLQRTWPARYGTPPKRG